jgi:prepilin-type N-terminal cleavage/methylation domain-containing protein
MKSTQSGFTIVEVVVAMVMLSVILGMMGSLIFSAARQSITNGTAAQRQAASMELVNRYATLPFAGLQPYRDTVNFAGNLFERTVTVTTFEDSAVVVVRNQPLLHGVSASQVRLVRSRNAAATNSLCTPSC